MLDLLAIVTIVSRKVIGRMAKQLVATLKLLVAGGQAPPAPPVGPALGQHGVNIGEFVRRFNEATRNLMGMKVGLLLNVYSDRSFEMVIKGPPVSALLKKAAGIAKGSGVPNKEKVGKVNKEQVIEIAKEKMTFMNCKSIENAVRLVEGTARSMGMEIVG